MQVDLKFIRKVKSNLGTSEVHALYVVGNMLENLAYYSADPLNYLHLSGKTVSLYSS